MNAGQAILAAHALPLQRFGEAVRAFWPLLAMWGLIVAAALAIGVAFEPQGGSIGAWGLLVPVVAIYALLLAARGAVSWHRMMILGERVPWTPVVPGGSGLRYAGWVIALGLLFGLVYIAVAAVVLGPLVASFFAGGDTSPESVRRINLIVQVPAFLIYAAILALLAGPILNLPKSAVGAGERPHANGTARWTLIGSALPLALLASVLQALLGPALGVVGAALLVVLNTYASLVALTGLSIAYRAAEGS